MARCCDDGHHLTNFGTKGYAKGMGNSLVEIHSWLDDLAHGKRISNYEVMCPSSAIGLDNNLDKTQIARMWGKDPVHLATAGYSMLAEKIVEKATELRAKHPPADRAKPNHETKPPIRQAANGLERVSRSDLADTRWGGEISNPQRSAAQQKRAHPDGHRAASGGQQDCRLRH